MKIDVGCGKRGTKHDGFVGVDVHPPKGVRRGEYIHQDASKGLPFDDASVDEAICLHVIEHMKRDDGVKMLAEIHRVLKVGAVAHIATPDLRLLAQRYLSRDEDFYGKRYNGSALTLWKGPTLGDKFMDAITGMGPHGHTYGYDLESLEEACAEAGFGRITQMPGNPYGTRTDHEIIVTVQRS